MGGGGSTHQSKSPGSGDQKYQHSKQPVDTHHVYMLGACGVGKVALISQFTTSECINAYEGPGEEIGRIDRSAKKYSKLM